MANIEVASVCNLGCPFCFAKKHLSETNVNSSESNYITLADFEKRLDFLDHSMIDQVRLIGGEPTLHPEFPELIRRAKLRKKRIVIYSHGLIPKRALHSILDMSSNECVVLINTNASRSADGPTRQELDQRNKNIVSLGPRAMLGYTIYSKNFEVGHLLSIVREADCHRLIRFGLAHPIIGEKNRYLHPKEYEIVGRKLVRFARAALLEGVQIEFDCGFVRCMFSDDDIEFLKSTNADVGWRCNPVVDVTISGKAIMCFPTAGIADYEIADNSLASDIRNNMQKKISLYRTAGIFPECSTCGFKIAGECSGGGIENTIRRFQHTSFHIGMLS